MAVAVTALDGAGHSPEFIEQIGECARILDKFFPSMYGQPVAERACRGLEVLWPRMTLRERADLFARRDLGAIANAMDELLAADAFAQEFGADAITLPQVDPSACKPEFFVHVEGVRIAVECVSISDSKAIQDFRVNPKAVGTCLEITDESVVNRIRRSLMGKVAQLGGVPFVLLISSRSFDVRPDHVAAAARLVFEELGLKPNLLPIAVAGTWLTVLHGIWLCEHAIKYAALPASHCDRIRNAIVRRYLSPTDGDLLTESDWA